ncbi:UDP-galactose transporter Gms1 [Savitreella phatthalungensis]
MSALGDARLYGVPIKYLSLVTLTVQNASLILLMHYSRVMDAPGGRRYLSSTAVLMNECLKLAISGLVVVFVEGKKSMGENWSAIGAFRRAFSTDNTTLKLAIPAGLYTIQNNLQYLAVSNLDAATFQVTYQFKIITTAIFSVTLLHRQLSGLKWLAILILTAGIALVQIPSGTSTPAPASSHAGEMNQVTGLVAVVVACVLSGLAGVYFEKVLKGSKQSFWALNMQLSLWSIPLAGVFGCLIKDGGAIMEHGFFDGYNGVVWAVVVCQAVGGLVVAMCVAYADNLLKNFATSISIVISALVSVHLFAFKLTRNFLIGAALVLAATYLYGLPDNKPATPTASTGATSGQAYQLVDRDDTDTGKSTDAAVTSSDEKSSRPLSAEERNLGTHR